MSDVVVLHRLLRRHRRRWATVRAVVHLARIMVLAVAAAGVWLLLTPEPPFSSPQTPLLATVAAGLVAVAMWWAVPDVSATARAIDRRAGLDDRLATALQVARDDDPVARLIVRDAATRLRRLRPTRVFPLEAPPHGRVWLSAGVLLVAGLLVHAFPSGASAPRAGGIWMADASAGAAPPPGTDRSSARDVPHTQARAPSGASVIPSVAPGVEAAGSAPGTPEASGAVRSPATPSGSAAAAPPAATTSRAEAGTEARAASRLAADAAGRAGTADTSSGSTNRGGSGSANKGGAADVLDGAAGPGESAAGSTSGAGATAAAAGGGVRHGSLATVGATAARLPAPGSAAYADRYRDASRRADAALADERVPVRLRAHVRAYFAAIRPPGQP